MWVAGYIAYIEEKGGGGEEGEIHVAFSTCGTYHPEIVSFCGKRSIEKEF